MNKSGRTKLFWFGIVPLVILAGVIGGGWLWYDLTQLRHRANKYGNSNGCVVVIDLENSYGLKDIVLEQEGPDGTVVELLRIPQACAQSERSGDTFGLVLTLRPGQEQGTLQPWVSTFSVGSFSGPEPVGEPLPIGIGQMTSFGSASWTSYMEDLGFLGHPKYRNEPLPIRLGFHSLVKPGDYVSNRIEYRFRLRYKHLSK